MQVRLTVPGLLGALVLVLTAWILHSYLLALRKPSQGLWEELVRVSKLRANSI